jgi:hypothetical protein
MGYPLVNKYIYVLYILLNIGSISLCYGQTDDNYYTLYQGGDLIEKKKVYLLLNSDSVDIINDGKILIINYHKNSFIHNPYKYQSKVIDKEFLANNSFRNLKELYDFEEAELSSQMKKVLQEKGFKIIPPLKHIVLKVFLILKFDNENILYEVDWI